MANNYSRQLSCTCDGRIFLASQNHPWTSKELDARYILPCPALDSETMHEFVALPDTDKARRPLPVARDQVRLAAVSVKGADGREVHTTALQESHLEITAGVETFTVVLKRRP